jgi:polyisoprenyl-teichoic acid--peptidoglycan teichoic acid transferase
MLCPRKCENHSDKLMQHQPSQHRKYRKMRFVLAGLGITSLLGGALIANFLSTTPLLKQQLRSTDPAVFHGDDAFSRNILQVPVISKPVNILLLGIKTNLSDIKNSDGKERKKNWL